ncbi:MAG: hypothetical protein H0W88_07160 [Parachlamydiaceae bacterium]|nr:hypothetical protein [Parachlamydiaceae bacterium]
MKITNSDNNRCRVPLINVLTFCFTTFFSFLFVEANGVESKPWVSNYLEFEWRNSLLYQTYQSVESSSKLVDHSSDDLFFTTNLSNAVDPDFSVEVELTAAKTRKQKGNVDNFRLAGRYVWLDDVAGDPITLTTGLCLTQAFLNSLNDISSFHHGRSEAEFFISVGKETALCDMWQRRWWVVCGCGLAERGSAWIRGDVNYEYRLLKNHELRLFLNSLWGFGHKQLHFHHFHGYGSINHQSVDLGFGYTYVIDFVGSINAAYSYRVFEHNFPAQAQCVLLNFLYPFGF